MEFGFFSLMIMMITVLFVNNSISINDQTNEAIRSEIKLLLPEDWSGILEFANKSNSILSEEVYREFLKDTGYGNPGDLIYRYRESNDVLQIREVIVLPEISSNVQEVSWYGVVPAISRISSVRVLNFGRERAFTIRIDVARNEAQTIFRIPSNYDPRIMIEVYGY